MSTHLAYAALRAPASPTLVFDIETVSAWDQLPEGAKAALWKRWEKAQARMTPGCRDNPADDPELSAALSPWTGKVIVIALWSAEKAKGRVLYSAGTEGAEGAEGTDAPHIEGDWRYEPYADERALLEAFWATLARCADVRMAGFNSRNFDASFLMTRSFVLGIKATMNLLPYRYSTKEHLDLHDVLGGWGASRCPSLEVICEVTGVASSKRGMDGSEVEQAWGEGRVLDIARYCAEDVRATVELANRWDTTLGSVFGERRKY